MNSYCGAKATLTTKHGKERLIAKPFWKALGVKVITPTDIDTDILGTFTGEVPRIGTMREVVIKKARLGMELTGSSLGIASEGSFGPHPYIPFVGSDLEMLVFIDDNKKFVLVEQLLTMKTNFSYIEVTGDEYPNIFLKQIGFPKNAVIVKPKTSTVSGVIYKGIVDENQLIEAIKVCRGISNDSVAHIETDMRAHLNQQRRQTIRHLAFKLVRKLQQSCPICETPGWGVVDTQKGLPCEVCATATTLVQNEILGCTKCDYKEIQPRADGVANADAKYCSYCNP